MVEQGVFSTGAIGAYCTTDAVLALLVGQDLSALGTAEQIHARIEALLADTAKEIDATAGRDFLYHAGAQLLLDGNGTDCLSFLETGAIPILDVKALSVDGTPIALNEIIVGSDDASLRLTSGVFTHGRGNVAVTLDWGFVVPPSDIATAQAKLIAAELLEEASGGEAAESVRIGDYEVRYSGETTRRLTEAARRAAGRYRSVRIGTV